MSEPPPCVASQYYKKTRRGRVMRVVRDRYLRDDLGFGSLCAATSLTRITSDDQLVEALRDDVTDESGRILLLVLDTNVLINQFTALSSNSPVVKNVVLCETVMSETLKLKRISKDKLAAIVTDTSRSWLAFPNEHHRDTFEEKMLGESANDHNDRLVRRVAQFYASNLRKRARVIMVSDDADNLARLKSEEVTRKSGATGMRMVELADFIKIKFPTFIDFVARKSNEVAHLSDITLSSLPKVYPEHQSLESVEEGIKAGRLFQGTVRMRSSRVCGNEDEGAVLVFGLVPGNPEQGTRVSLVGNSDLNRAVEGDRVAVEVFPLKDQATKKTKAPVVLSSNDEEEHSEEEEPPTTSMERFGRVVCLMKKNWRACAGTLVEDFSGLNSDVLPLVALGEEEDTSNERTVVFYPMDTKLPPMLVRTRQMDQLKSDRVVCQMDAWSTRSRYPSAHFVKSLGQLGEKETETAAVLFEHDIPTEDFSPAVMACLPTLGKSWTPNSEGPLPSWRVDLRNVEEICSVDPPGCKDIDDALHCRVSPSNPDRLEIGVHIADVSHFVLPNTAIDLEARHRGTSTYLVERRLDMLPGLLTTDICSLVGHKERFTFSVLFETSLDGKDFIGEPKFFKSVIQSRGALTYDQAQEMIMSKEDSSSKDSSTFMSIRRLNMVAKHLRARRIENGALTLASQEVRFELDEETQDPTSVKKYVQKDAHHMVEEFMLLANCAVAEKIERVYPRKALLRRHPKPSEEMLDELVASGRAAGVELEVTSSKALADSLDRAQRADQPTFNQILRIVTTRAMQQAKYFCTGFVETRKDFLHYGLAVPVYTHFTSPIRRYADLVVHRLLGAAIGLHPLFEGYERREDVRAVADNLNRRHRNAQKAGRASSAIHTVVLFRTKPPQEVDAYVSGISALRINVMIPEYGLEEVLTGAEGDVDKATMSVVLRPSGRRLTIFDKIRVKLFVETVGPAKRQKLVVQLLDSIVAVKRTSEAKPNEADVKKPKPTTTSATRINDKNPPSSKRAKMQNSST